MKIKMQKKFLKCNSKKEYTNKSKHLKNKKSVLFVLESMQHLQQAFAQTDKNGYG